MGYPLRQTNIYSLVKQLLELQRNSRKSDGVTSFLACRCSQDNEKTALSKECPDQYARDIIQEINDKNLYLFLKIFLPGKGIA